MEINLDNYELAPEEKETNKYINLINIYICHYRRVYNSDDPNIFKNIDNNDITSTNRYLELFYQEIEKFNSIDDEKKNTLYHIMSDKVNMDDHKELYILFISNKPQYMANNLIILLDYLSEKDWENISWSIFPIKK